MRFFGTARECDPSIELARTPVGVGCFHCGETIVQGDIGFMVGHFDLSNDPNLPEVVANEVAYHRECFLRLVLGSIAHQDRTCHCYTRRVEKSAKEQTAKARRSPARQAAKAERSEQHEHVESAVSKRHAARAAVSHWSAKSFIYSFHQRPQA